MESSIEKIHTIRCKVMDSLGRVSIRTLKYRVDYDVARSFFRWEKVPGQKEDILSL